MSQLEEESVPSVVTPKEEMEEKHKELALDMFKKITEYLNGELAGKLSMKPVVCFDMFPPPPVTSEEYQLLLRLNQMTIAKYSDMTSLAARLNQVSDKLKEKCELTSG